MSACTEATEATEISALLAAAAALVTHEYAEAAEEACKNCGEGSGSGSGSGGAAPSTEPSQLSPTNKVSESDIMERIRDKYRTLKALGLIRELDEDEENAET